MKVPQCCTVVDFQQCVTHPTLTMNDADSTGSPKVKQWEDPGLQHSGHCQAWLPLQMMFPPCLSSLHAPCMQVSQGPVCPTAADNFSYLVPLGLGLLLLEPAVLPAVKQLCQEPPDQQEHQADESHTGDGPTYNQPDVGRLRALCRANIDNSSAAPVRAGSAGAQGVGRGYLS